MNDDEAFELYYEHTLRQIMWGDSRGEAKQRMMASNISETMAAKIVEAAWQERVSVIRAVFWKKVLFGGALFIVGLALTLGVYYISEGYTVWSTNALLIPLAPVVVGLWKLIAGVSGVFTASAMSGPVSDIE